MADYELIEERLISGKGVLKVPPDKTKNRHSVLYLDVIREPRNKYYNGNWNPIRSRYAQMTFRRDEYIIGTATMEFERQAYDSIADISGQNLIAIKCMYEGILISFVNIAIAQGLVLTSYQDLIKDYESLNLGWEEVLIQCYADTAIQARLYRLQYDACDPSKDNQKKPPPPPPPLPKVPPGTGIGDISEAYDGDNDGGNSEPFDGDETPPPFEPLPDNTRLKWNLSTNLNPRTTYAQAVFATFTPVSGYTLTQGNTDAGLNVREWLSNFTSGTSNVAGSAVGTLNPEDKPVLYLWQEGVTDEPWQVILP